MPDAWITEQLGFLTSDSPLFLQVHIGESFPLPVFYFYNLAFISSSYSIWLGAEARLAQKADATRRASAHQEMSEFLSITVRQGKGRVTLSRSQLVAPRPATPSLQMKRPALSLICHIDVSFKGTSATPALSGLLLWVLWHVLLASPRKETYIDHVEACLSYNAFSCWYQKTQFKLN